MASTWYFRRNEQHVGPISSAALRQMAAIGMLAPDDLVAKDATGPWVPASRVKGLFASSDSNKSIPEEHTSSKSSQSQKSDGIDSDRSDKTIESPTASRPVESPQQSTSLPCVTLPEASATDTIDDVHDTTSHEAPSFDDAKTPTSASQNTFRMSSTIPALLNSERNKRQLDALEDFSEWIRNKAVTFSRHTLIPATKWGFLILCRFAAIAWSKATSRLPSNPSLELAASSDPSASVSPVGQAPSQSPDEMVNTLASNDGGSSLNAKGLSKPNLWNPTAALLWGLLFSWVFSVVLLGLNWRALGNRQGVTRCLYWLAAIIPYGLFVWAMGSESVLVTIAAWALFLGVAIFEYRPQAALLSHDLADSYTKRKWVCPLSAGASVALLAVWQPHFPWDSTPTSVSQSPVGAVSKGETPSDTVTPDGQPTGSDVTREGMMPDAVVKQPPKTDNAPQDHHRVVPSRTLIQKEAALETWDSATGLYLLSSTHILALSGMHRDASRTFPPSCAVFSWPSMTPVNLPDSLKQMESTNLYRSYQQDKDSSHLKINSADKRSDRQPNEIFSSFESIASEAKGTRFVVLNLGLGGVWDIWQKQPALAFWDSIDSRLAFVDLTPLSPIIEDKYDLQYCFKKTFYSDGLLWMLTGSSNADRAFLSKWTPQGLAFRYDLAVPIGGHFETPMDWCFDAKQKAFYFLYPSSIRKMFTTNSKEGNKPTGLILLCDNSSTIPTDSEAFLETVPIGDSSGLITATKTHERDSERGTRLTCIDTLDGKRLSEKIEHELIISSPHVDKVSGGWVIQNGFVYGSAPWAERNKRGLGPHSMKMDFEFSPDGSLYLLSGYGLKIAPFQNVKDEFKYACEQVFCASFVSPTLVVAVIGKDEKVNEQQLVKLDYSTRSVDVLQEYKGVTAALIVPNTNSVVVAIKSSLNEPARIEVRNIELELGDRHSVDESFFPLKSCVHTFQKSIYAGSDKGLSSICNRTVLGNGEIVDETLECTFDDKVISGKTMPRTVKVGTALWSNGKLVLSFKSESGGQLVDVPLLLGATVGSQWIGVKGDSSATTYSVVRFEGGGEGDEGIRVVINQDGEVFRRECVFQKHIGLIRERSWIKLSNGTEELSFESVRVK